MALRKVLGRRELLAPMAAAAASGAILFLAPGKAAAEMQPQMQMARRNLLEARQSLQRATSDKGGHRVRAMRLIDQALAEVEAGIRFDNRR
jgi:hypothetical protein